MNNSSTAQFLISVLKLSRVNNLIIIFLTQYGAAVFLLNERKTAQEVLLDWSFFVMVMSTVIIAAAGYYINDYYDVKIDLINKPQKVVVGRGIRRRPVLMAHTILNLIGVLMGMWVSLWIGGINVVVSLLLWWYSNHLKKMPFLGNALVAVLTGATLIITMVYYQTDHILGFTYAFFAIGITLVREIIKDVEDMDGDENYGAKTLPIILGVRKTKKLLYFILFFYVVSLAAFLIVINHSYLSIYFFALSIPFFFFVQRLVVADTKKEFSALSDYAKWIIIAGILSMLIFGI